MCIYCILVYFTLNYNTFLLYSYMHVLYINYCISYTCHTIHIYIYIGLQGMAGHYSEARAMLLALLPKLKECWATFSTRDIGE